MSFVFTKRKNRNHLLENESTKLVAFAHVSKTSHALMITIDGEGRQPIYCFERDKLVDNMGDRQINSIVVIRKQRNYKEGRQCERGKREDGEREIE